MQVTVAYNGVTWRIVLRPRFIGVQCLWIYFLLSSLRVSALHLISHALSRRLIIITTQAKPNNLWTPFERFFWWECRISVNHVAPNIYCICKVVHVSFARYVQHSNAAGASGLDRPKRSVASKIVYICVSLIMCYSCVYTMWYATCLYHICQHL